MREKETQRYNHTDNWRGRGGRAERQRDRETERQTK